MTSPDDARKDLPDETGVPEEEPQVFALRRQGAGWTLSRRDFTVAGGAAGAAALTGCGGDKGKKAGKGGAAEGGQLMMQDEGEEGEDEPSHDQKPGDPRTPEGRCYRAYAHTAAVRALAVNPDGTLLASGGSDGAVKIWSLPDGGYLHTLRGHTKPVNGLVFIGDQLISDAGDGVRIWRLPAGPSLGSIPPPAPVSGVFGTLSRVLDGEQVVVSGGDKTTLLAVPKLEVVRTLDHGERLSSARVSDGKLLVGGNAEGEVKVWKLDDGSLVEKKELHNSFVNVVAVTTDGEVLASGGVDTAIRLWSGQSFQGHEGGVYALAFSPDGKTLASGSSDRTIRLWSIPDGKPLGVLKGHGSTVLALAFTPGGVLVSGAADRSIRVWSPRTGKLRGCLMDLAATPRGVQGIKFARADEKGRTVTSTLPCGSPLPGGAVCVCNCVSGSWAPASTARRPKRPTNWGGPTTTEGSVSSGKGSSGRGSSGKSSSSGKGRGWHYWYPN